MGPFPKFNRAEASYELFCSLCLRHFNSKLQVLCAIVKGTMQNSSMVSFNGSEYRNIGVLLIGIGYWGPLYYNDNKEPPKIM